jgi:uncharacterized protein (TIRG00374 family)
MQTRKHLLTAGKVALSLGLLGFLAVLVSRDEGFGDLVLRPKNWPVLAAALPVCLAAVTLTILRWQLFVRTLDLSFTVRDVLRAGFLGYAFNLIPAGLVAGDSVKALMLIHKNPRRKTEAVASVLADRVIGLYGLLLLAAIGTLLLEQRHIDSLKDATERATIVNLCYIVQGLAAVSTLGLVVMLIPGVTQSRLWDLLEHTPLVGLALHKMVGAMRAYRRRFDVLLAGIGISLVIHMLYVSAVVLMTMGIGIPPEHRPQPQHIFVIVPPTMIAGALPIGFYEISITLLFQAIAPPGAPEKMGLLIGLGYRIIQVLIASIGVAYWLTSRSEVREIVHEAEVTPPEDLASGDRVGSAEA